MLKTGMHKPVLGSKLSERKLHQAASGDIFVQVQ
jgi:hypothetical protein